MSVVDQPTKPASQVIPWQRILPCLTVFAAAFVLFAMAWPAMSPGVRASISVDFCLPKNTPELSHGELSQLKSTIAGQVSSQLIGPEFESLIQQTQQTGKVVSSVIEFSDRETIAENIELGFAFNEGTGRLQVDYVCQGNEDQLRFLQLLGQRLATSIDDLVLSPNNQIIAGNQFNGEKFDRAIWLANQIQSDLDQIRDEHINSSNYNGSRNNGRSPYAFASTTHVTTEPSPNKQPMMADALNSIDATSLSGLLTEIKSETIAPHTNDATISVLKVDPVRTWAVNATPDRWAMIGLLAMAGLVSGFFALYQFPLPKQPTNVDALSDSLGIPVVAVLTTDQTTQPKFGSVEFFAALANPLFVTSKIFLIAITVVVVGFALIDSSIRESLLQNPFDGVARIFRVFFGFA